MTPLQRPFSSAALRFWRIDREKHATSWDDGYGASLAGGRWNSKVTYAVYAALDLPTAIIEYTVHAGFTTLDASRHVLTSAVVTAPEHIRVVNIDDIPDLNWLAPGSQIPERQAFGDDLIENHAFILIPSTVVRGSWTLIMNPQLAEGLYGDVHQESFALDPR